MNNLIITILLLFVLGSSVKADLLPDGKKRISYSFEVTNLDSFPGYTFVAFPINNSNGIPMIFGSVLKSSMNIELPCKFGSPVVYAIKNEDFDGFKFDSLNQISDNNSRSAQLSEFMKKSKFIPSLKITCSSFADRDAKYYYVQELFRIESIDADTMIIRSTKTLYKDTQKNIIDAKDSKGGVKDDIVSPTEKYSSYLLIIIPVLALVAIVSIVLIRKMKK
ncbi:MAG: hypothetical protein HOP31_06990 [Ignavibacteria bacterium]|nr:hypothetical protein [Ignavibacteria bacterium]